MVGLKKGVGRRNELLIEGVEETTLTEGVQVDDAVTSTLTDGVGPEGVECKLGWDVVSGLLDGIGLREDVGVWIV